MAYNYPPFTQRQKGDLERLWKSQSREYGDPHESSKRTSIDSTCLGMTLRLHAFFFAFLKKHLTEKPDAANDRNLFLKKNVQESCLEPIYAHFVEKVGGNNEIRLSGRKAKITLPQKEFLLELNEFESRGQYDESWAKNSYGAYQYHFPILALPALNVAMGLAVVSLWRRLMDDNIFSTTVTTETKLEAFLDSYRVTTRFVHVNPRLPMSDIKTGLLEKFISVKGNVVKVRPKRLRVVTADFECNKCAAVAPYTFKKGQYSLPTKCPNTTCKSKSFTMIRPTARYTNVQEIRLQEAQEESTIQAGRTPRQFEVELKDDLIDSCRPGDIIILACFVDAINSALASGRAGKRAKETSTYKLFLQAHSIITLSESNGGGKSLSGVSQVTYTQQQLNNITQLCHADHRYLSMVERRAFPFDLLVSSICPSIIGHHAVKCGILLCLLGGTPPVSQQIDRGNTIRSNSHILIVGDPGMYIELSPNV